MKYKVGDKTLLGKITRAENLGFTEYLVDDRWYSEDQIDAIIIKPKMNTYHLQEVEDEYRDALAGFNHPDEGGFCQGVVRGVNTVMWQLGYVWHDNGFKKEREVEK